MTALPNTTLRRLMSLPQTPSVWEGDRRSLDNSDVLDLEEKTGQFILWVDGAEGMVRSMDVVPQETGPEAIVRALVKAMEHPQPPARPARPQKIIVRDREIQFFLRGVLQDLEIAVDYVPDLPIIDELFERLAEIRPPRHPKLPSEYSDLLIEKAYEIWADAPWELVADHQVVSVELNQWDLGTLYCTVMGMLELDYGIVLYRSLDSLRRFRLAAINQNSRTDLEGAFLGQDCLFITFSAESEDDDVDLEDLPLSEITPQFGSIHPFEGLRPTLYEEEAIALAVTLEALHQFFHDSQRKLHNNFPRLKKNYNITPPPDPKHPEITPQPVPIKVITMPEVADELMEMEATEDDGEDFDFNIPLREGLIPNGSFISLGIIPWENLELIKAHIKHYQPEPTLEENGEGLAMLMIQTTRPKAKEVVEKIVAAGGLEGILFNVGEDPFHETTFDLGILQLKNKELYIFQEFPTDSPVHIKAKKNWNQRCQKTKNICSLIIATGLTGASKGNPSPKDMYAIFEVKHIDPEELGMGKLQMMMQMDW